VAVPPAEIEGDVSGMAKRRSRGTGRTAVASGLVLAAGLLAGAASGAAGAVGATSTHTARISLAYACQSASGKRELSTQKVTVVIAATFPVEATAGRSIQPTGLHVTAVLPESAVSDLRKIGAATASGSDALTMIEAYPGRTTSAAWHARSGAAALPATGSLQLAAAGTVPPAVAASKGTVTFTAGALALHLVPRTADGAATSPATVKVACTPSSGSSARLASVPVGLAAESNSRPDSQQSHVAAGLRAKLPKGCGHIKVVGFGIATCAYITGYSDVAKLGGAVLLQPRPPLKPGLVNLDYAERHVFKNGKLIAYSNARLYYHGRPELPPVQGTFLAFGFVPVRATLHLTELTPIRIVSASGYSAPPYPISVRATTKVAVRISGVSVNGVPLNVGPHCQTAKPVTLVLIGKGENTLPPKGYTVPTGGPLWGTPTIPPFTGCGLSENLDRLLTGTISGPGNHLEQTQGKLCGPSQPANWVCPPPVPKPIH
jgi:hypothetical protein